MPAEPLWRLVLFAIANFPGFEFPLSSLAEVLGVAEDELIEAIAELDVQSGGATDLDLQNRTVRASAICAAAAHIVLEGADHDQVTGQLLELSHFNPSDDDLARLLDD